LDLRGRKLWKAVGNCIMRSFTHFRFTKYYEGDQNKEGERAGTCSTHERDEKWIQYFGSTT